jgi:hypothetical protein
MTVEDLLLLFQSINEGVVNILGKTHANLQNDYYVSYFFIYVIENYFEMNKKDAKEALDIYKSFAQQTEHTIEYLNDARRLQNEMKMSIPAIKHVR